MLYFDWVIYMLSKNEMYQAVINSDEKYDGLFFYGVKTVGVFCKVSCKSRNPLEKNVLYFSSKEEALKSGFRPCKRCRPDLLNYEPLNDLADLMKVLIDDYYTQRKELYYKSKKLGVSTNHLAMIFRKKYGMSPKGYRDKLRLEYAIKLLVETEFPIITIAHEIGFESLSSFYSFFGKHENITPKLYRIKNSCKSNQL